MEGPTTRSEDSWLTIRLGTLLLSTLGARGLLAMPGDFSKPSWIFFLEMIGLSAIGTYFVLLLQRFNPWSSTEWERPSWRSNPFNLAQPLVMFHFAAFALLAAGISSFLFGMLSTTRNWVWELPMSAGIGVWVGVWLSAPPKANARSIRH